MSVKLNKIQKNSSIRKTIKIGLARTIMLTIVSNNRIYELVRKSERTAEITSKCGTGNEYLEFFGQRNTQLYMAAN